MSLPLAGNVDGANAAGVNQARADAWSASGKVVIILSIALLSFFVRADFRRANVSRRGGSHRLQRPETAFPQARDRDSGMAGECCSLGAAHRWQLVARLSRPSA
ncbi:MAG: hypothetical protein KDI82_00240 [Gammaproteobacteria bacterium]|nr:hypothetical protein [Gammaproteobacteria bacterium]